MPALKNGPFPGTIIKIAAQLLRKYPGVAQILRTRAPAGPAFGVWKFTNPKPGLFQTGRHDFLATPVDLKPAASKVPAVRFHSEFILTK